MQIIANKATQLCNPHLSPEDERFTIISYGFYHMILTFSSTTLIALIGIFLYMLPESLLCHFVFSFIRVKTGGYHTDSYLKCFTLTSISQSMLAFIASRFSYTLDETAWLINVLFLLAIILAVALAPIDTPNKRFATEENIKYRKDSLIRLLLVTSAHILITVLYQRFYIIDFALMLVGMSVLVGYIQNKTTTLLIE